MLSTRLLVRLACTVAALTAMQLATPQFATLAYASPTDDEVRAARELYSQAVQDEDAERWEEARDKLKRVAKVKPTAGISYHVALCEEHLGHLATALALYLVAQEEATRTEAQDVLRLVGPQLTSLGPRVPHLTFQTEPTLRNPSVTLDGAAVASSHLDIPLPVDPGLHHIEASALGRVSSNTTIELHEGDATVFRVSLVPSANPSSSAAPAAGAPQPAAAPSTPLPSRSASSSSPVSGIVAATGAGVLAGLGIGAFVAAGSAHTDAVRECAEMTTSCTSLRQPVRTWDWVAFGAWSGAAASATLAAFLWARHPAEESQRGAHLVVGPGSLGVAGSF
jgi:hypothetical protein